MIKVALIQKICPHYRVSIFKRLAKEVDLMLYYGKGQKKGSFQSVKQIEGFKSKKLFALSFSLHMTKRSYYINWFPFLLLHLIKYKPQVIITEGATNILNNISILVFAKATKTPFIWWDAGRDMNAARSTIRKSMDPLLDFFAKQTSAVIAYGEKAKKYFCFRGILSKKIFIAQNTADFGIANKDRNQYFKQVNEKRRMLSLDNKRVILYVGAIEKRRKLKNLLLVFKEIKLENKDIALIIIGDGPERDNIEKIIKSEDIKDVYVLGRIIEEVGLYFALCDIFVLPGCSSLAINQALFYGKPVITVAYGGPEYELVKNGENGFIVDRNNDEQLKEAISKIILDSELRIKMEKESLKLSKHVTVENMVVNIMKAVYYAYNLQSGAQQIKNEKSAY